LKELLAKQNSRSTKQKFDYDNREFDAAARQARRLIKVKAGRAAANAEIYDKNFRLAELKGLVANTHESRHESRCCFTKVVASASRGYEVEYVAQLGRWTWTKLVAELQDEIQTLQDALDEFKLQPLR